MSDLLKYTAGGEMVPIRDRQVAKQAKASYDDVRLKAMQADGAMALAGHIMQGMVELDALRLSLSSGDPVTTALLAEIEANTVRQVKSIQNSLYDRWGL